MFLNSSQAFRKSSLRGIQGVHTHRVILSKPRWLSARMRYPPKFVLLSHALILKHCSSEPPTRYGMIVFTGFQALGKPNPWRSPTCRDQYILTSRISSIIADVFGPLSALNVLSRTREMQLAVIAESTAPVSTNPDPNPFVSASFGQDILPTHTFDNAPDIEVLLIPGGQ